MSERVLTVRELNRALLARQLLLERSALSITRALEQVGGLQAQYAPSPSRESGAMRKVACASSHSLDFLRPPGARLRRRRNAWLLFTRTRWR
jgi:hypothetical protein